MQLTWHSLSFKSELFNLVNTQIVVIFSCLTENTMLYLWFHEILTPACSPSLNSDTSKGIRKWNFSSWVTNDFTTRVPGKVCSFMRGLVDVTNKATVAEASSLTRGRSRKGIEFVFWRMFLSQFLRCNVFEFRNRKALFWYILRINEDYVSCLTWQMYITWEHRIW